MRFDILQQARRSLVNGTAVLPTIRIVDANGAYSHVGLVQVRTSSDRPTIMKSTFVGTRRYTLRNLASTHGVLNAEVFT